MFYSNYTCISKCVCQTHLCFWILNVVKDAFVKDVLATTCFSFTRIYRRRKPGSGAGFFSLTRAAKYLGHAVNIKITVQRSVPIITDSFSTKSVYAVRLLPHTPHGDKFAYVVCGHLRVRVTHRRRCTAVVCCSSSRRKLCHGRVLLFSKLVYNNHQRMNV